MRLLFTYLFLGLLTCPQLKGATAAAQLASKFIEAANSGQASSFVRDHLGADASARMSPEKCLTLLSNLHLQSGDLRIERVFMDKEREFRGMLSSAKAGKKVALELVVSNLDTNRAKWLWLHHLAMGPSLKAPKEKLSLSDQIKTIESYLEEWAKVNSQVGAVLIAKKEDVLLHKAYGYAHSGKKLPNLTNMLYDTASIGKMFTAIAIAQLEEAGKLNYGDTIGKHLPEYPNQTARDNVQILHLLAHTGGLGDPFDSPKLGKNNYKTQADYFETFAEKPLAFEPGARHEYSNGGYIVLAAIVEKISGISFVDYLQANVFTKAGMQNTGLTSSSTNFQGSVPHFIKVIEDPLGTLGAQPKAEAKKARNGQGMGGWTSTTTDLYNFARALRTNKLLSKEATSRLTTGIVPAIPGRKEIKYAMGCYEIPIGSDRLVGHSGGGEDSGIGAELEMLWNSEHTIVVLGNYSVEQSRQIAHSIARFLEKQSN